MLTEQKDALFRLNTFCNKNKIEYAVTGTCALSLLGVPSNSYPRDLDIKIYHADERILNKLKELDFLCNLTPATYEGSTTYTFTVNGVKVNALLDDKSSYEDMDRELIRIDLIDNTAKCRHLINVQTMQYAWAAKMKLGRAKDAAYAMEVINCLTLPMV